MDLDGVADEVVMCLQSPGHRPPRPIPQPGRPHDIGEQERHQPAGQRRGGRRRGGLHLVRAAGGEARGSVLRQHGLFEVAKFRAGIDAELVGQGCPQSRVGAQGVGLASLAVEGDDEVGPDPLAQWVIADRGLGLGDRLGVLPERQPGFQQCLNRDQAGLFEPAGLAGGPACSAELAEHRTPPPSQGTHQEANRCLRVPAGC
jgi:hypothetical protein